MWFVELMKFIGRALLIIHTSADHEKRLKVAESAIKLLTIDIKHFKDKERELGRIEITKIKMLNKELIKGLYNNIMMNIELLHHDDFKADTAFEIIAKASIKYWQNLESQHNKRQQTLLKYIIESMYNPIEYIKEHHMAEFIAIFENPSHDRIDLLRQKSKLYSDKVYSLFEQEFDRVIRVRRY